MISVCIVTRNNEHNILETLESVKNQSYSNFECIIVDDYSTDDTVKVIGEFCKSDDRFKMFVNTANKSLPYTDAHSKSYEYATGKYLFRVNPDTILVNNHFELLTRFMDEHPKCDVCCSNVMCGQEIKGPTDSRRLEILRKYPITYFQETSWNCLQHMFHKESSVIRRDTYINFGFHYLPYTNGYADDTFFRSIAAHGLNFDKIEDVTVIDKGNNSYPYEQDNEVSDISNYYCALFNLVGHSLYLDEVEEYNKIDCGNILYKAEIYLNTVTAYMNSVINDGNWDKIEERYKYIHKDYKDKQ